MRPAAPAESTLPDVMPPPEDPLADIAPCDGGCTPAPPVVLPAAPAIALIVPTPLAAPPDPLDDVPPLPSAPPCATSSVPKLVALPLAPLLPFVLFEVCGRTANAGRADRNRHLRQWRTKQSRWEQPLRIAAGLSAATAATHAAGRALPASASAAAGADQLRIHVSR